MERQALRVTMLLGLLISLVGGTGIFAVFTDRATTGLNDVDTAALPNAADIRIEGIVQWDGTPGAFNCDADTDGVLWDRDNLSSAPFLALTASAGVLFGPSYLCVKNAGAADLTLTASVADLVDLDTDCTGDEEAVGDVTCGLDAGSGLPQAGELSSVLESTVDRVDCVDPSIHLTSNGAVPLGSIAGLDLGAATLTPGDVACIEIWLDYSAAADQTAIQLAQSDEAQWRFAFDGTVPGS
jgi:hypothetical protein